MQFVQAPQVQRDDGLEVAADRVKAADHAGATAERDDGDAARGAIADDLGYFFLVTGYQYGVGRILYAGILAAQQVQGRLSAGAQ